MDESASGDSARAQPLLPDLDDAAAEADDAVVGMGCPRPMGSEKGGASLAGDAAEAPLWLDPFGVAGAAG